MQEFCKESSCCCHAAAMQQQITSGAAGILRIDNARKLCRCKLTLFCLSVGSYHIIGIQPVQISSTNPIMRIVCQFWFYLHRCLCVVYTFDLCFIWFVALKRPTTHAFLPPCPWLLKSAARWAARVGKSFSFLAWKACGLRQIGLNHEDLAEIQLLDHDLSCQSKNIKTTAPKYFQMNCSIIFPFHDVSWCFLSLPSCKQEDVVQVACFPSVGIRLYWYHITIYYLCHLCLLKMNPFNPHLPVPLHSADTACSKSPLAW